MNKFSKKTAFGIVTAAAAATALAAGIAAPAMASTGHTSAFSTHADKTTSSTTSTVTKGQLDALHNFNTGDFSTGLTGGNTSNWSPVVVSPSIGVGDVASGNAIGSGNDVPLLSGNDVTAPLLSGNDTAIGNNDANGTSISNSVKNLVNGAISGNSAKGSSTSSAKDIIGDLNLDTLLGNR